MYAGLRHGLGLSSRTAEACYSRRRRLPVNLVRCRCYEAVERRWDGDAEHGLDDEKPPSEGGHTSTARDQHFQLSQHAPRKVSQNGRHQNGANPDGGAAPATPLPWDVLDHAQFNENRRRSMKLPWHSSREDDHSFLGSTAAFTEKTNGSGAAPPPPLPSLPFDSSPRTPVAPWMASATRDSKPKAQNASKRRVAWLEQDDHGAPDLGGNDGASAAWGRCGLINGVDRSGQDRLNAFGLPIRRQANNRITSNAPRDSLVSSVSESQSFVKDNAMSQPMPSRLLPAALSAAEDSFDEAEFERVMSQRLLPIRLPTRPSPTPTPSSSGSSFSSADLARAMREPLPSRPSSRPAFTRQDEKIDEDELARALREPLPSRLPLRAPPNLPGRRTGEQQVPQQCPLPPPSTSWVDSIIKRPNDLSQTAQVQKALPSMPSRPTQTLGVLESPKATWLESMMEKAKDGSRLSIFARDGRRPGGLLGPIEKRASLPWAKLKELEATNTRGPSYEKNWRLARDERYDRRRDEQGRMKVVAQDAREVQTPPVSVTVRELGMALATKAPLVMGALRRLGEKRVCPTTMVDPDTAELVAIELGVAATRAPHREWDVKRTVVTAEMAENLTPRAPVVSVMGHVDHGKTTLLDALRTSKVAGTESAGITQKIGAFSVKVKDSAVTFFDTPGHAAFKSMRHSTSRLTDIVIVVIAADDGVKTQTLEVLGLLKQLPNLAPVVAVTKVDKPGVDSEEAIDRISRQLLQHDVITEGYGGEVPIVPVSAVSREGFDDLLETLLLQAEIMELRADETAPGEGVVVDSSIVKGRGLVTDMLVSWGKLKVGDIVLAGMQFGKVKSMTGSDGKAIKEAGTAQPVRVIGFKGLPKMGDEVVVVESEEKARTIIGERERERQQAQLADQSEFIAAKRAKEELASRLKAEAQDALRAREKAIFDARIALRLANDRPDDPKAQAAAAACKEAVEKSILAANTAEERAKHPYEEEVVGGPKACNAVFKAEGFGMLEAMTQVLDGVPQDEVKLNVIRTGVGPVTQSDVDAAILAGAPIFAFNVGVERSDVKAMAQRKGVQIHTNKVIYRFLDDVKAVMSNLLTPDLKEMIVGEGQILEVFDTKGKAGDLVRVAGTSVSMGKLVRTHLFRVTRNGDVLKQELKVSSMRRFKDRVNEVASGKECGVALQDFADLEKGDVIQCYYTQEVKRHF